MTKVIIGNDHRGFPVVEKITKHVEEMGFEVVHVGCFSSESADYPTFAQQVAERVQNDKVGILICGSGIGVCMAANRFFNVRAATCRTSSDAEMTRKHNNANILCVGADVSSEDDIIAMVHTFLITRFEGGRHQRRVSMIDGGDGDVVVG